MVKIVKLSCKTTLDYGKTDYVQSAALGIWVKAGAADESNDVSGVSHFIEHMMFKGTDKRTAKEIASDVDKIGRHVQCLYRKRSHMLLHKDIVVQYLSGCRDPH